MLNTVTVYLFLFLNLGFELYKFRITCSKIRYKMLSKKKKPALRRVGTMWLKCFHLHVVPDAVKTKLCCPGMHTELRWEGSVTESVSLTVGHTHSLRSLTYISQSLSLTTEEIKPVCVSQDCGLFRAEGC